MDQSKSNKQTKFKLNSESELQCSTCSSPASFPAHRAAYLGHVDCMKCLFRKLSDSKILLDDENNSPLHAAASGGQLETLKYLLQFTRIPVQYQNNQGETCAHVATLRHRLECLKALLGGSLKKAQMVAAVKDRVGCTVLHYAVLVNDNDIAVWLLQRFGKNLANICNDDDVLPLHVAAAQGNIEFIRIATKYDVHMVSKRDRNGATAVFYAVQSGYLQCLKYLVEKAKADVQTTTSRGQSLLHAACLNGHAAIVQWLLAKMDKAAVFQQTNDAATTFHCASYGGHDIILMMLHKVGGNKRFVISSTDRRGNTTLHLASLNGHLDCVQFLLKLGAEPRSKNFNGQSSIEVAEKRGHTNVVACLTAAVLGNQETLKKKYVRHKSQNDISMRTVEVKRPNSMSTSGYSSGGAAASDGYGRTPMLLDGMTYNEPSSGYASSSDKGIKETINHVTWKAATDSTDSLVKSNWLLKRKEDERLFSDKTIISNYGVMHHAYIELTSPRQTTTPYGGPVLIHREIQTDFDPLEEDIIIVDERDQVIFSSVPTIPTIFTSSNQQQQKPTSSVQTASSFAFEFDGDSSSKKLKKRRRKTSPHGRSLSRGRSSSRDRRKATNSSKLNQETGIGEMQERKRNSSISSSDSSDDDNSNARIENRTVAEKGQLSRGEPSGYQVYAGIAAAEKIDEILKNELHSESESEISYNSKEKRSNVRTAVAIVHTNGDEYDNQNETLKRSVYSSEQSNSFGKHADDVVGPSLTFPIFHVPKSSNYGSQAKVDSEADTLDRRRQAGRRGSQEKVTSFFGTNVRPDNKIYVKSVSLCDLTQSDSFAANSFGNAGGSFSIADLSDRKMSHDHEQMSQFRMRKSVESVYFPPPPPAPPPPPSNMRYPPQPPMHHPPPPPMLHQILHPTDSSNSSSSNTRLFHKRNPATTFKARDKILSDHLQLNSKSAEDSGLHYGRKTVSEIKRQLDSKLSGTIIEDRRRHVNGASFGPPRLDHLGYSVQDPFTRDSLDAHRQTQPLRFFGTSNASDYALGNRMKRLNGAPNAIIKELIHEDEEEQEREEVEMKFEFVDERDADPQEEQTGWNSDDDGQIQYKRTYNTEF